MFMTHKSFFFCRCENYKIHAILLIMVLCSQVLLMEWMLNLSVLLISYVEQIKLYTCSQKIAL